MTVDRPSHYTLKLFAGEVLTVVAAPGSSGTIMRLGDAAGAPQLACTAISASQTKTFGPFNGPTRYDVICDAGSLNATTAQADMTGLIDAAVDALVAQLPSTDPAIAGALWSDNCVLKVSAGA